MIRKIGTEVGFICKECGRIISDKINVGAVEYSEVCTECIDKKFGIFRVMDLTKDDLSAMGYETDNLSADKMAEIADFLKSTLLISDYWEAVDQAARSLDIDQYRRKKGH